MTWPHPPSKYRARRCVVDDLSFASQKEARRYLVLRTMERAQDISELVCQPRFPITVNGHHVCDYVADFQYLNAEGTWVVEDCKSPITSRLPVYRLKVKLLKATHGITIQEV